MPIKSFGKRHLEDIEPEVNTMEAVAPWCTIDTRTGRLAVVLEEYNCFDAEMYADELELEEPIEFRDDQRSKHFCQRQSCLMDQSLTESQVNLGKWVLRHIFSNLVDEMVKRDEVFRKDLNEHIKKTFQRSNAPASIQIPTVPPGGWVDNNSAATPKANGFTYPMTPGMGIGVATPAVVSHLPGVPEDGAALLKQPTQTSRASTEKNSDYFSSTQINSAETKTVATPTGSKEEEKPPKSPADTDKENSGNGNGIFGKKFRMGMSFGSKKLGRSLSASAEKPVVVEEKAEEGSETSENGEKEKEVDNNFFGVVQKIRNEYDKLLVETPDQLIESGVTPSLPNETPVLKPPPLTTVIIQEETSGGVADLYRGTVGSVGEDASLIEERAPMWLGDLLLRVSLVQTICA